MELPIEVIAEFPQLGGPSSVMVRRVHAGFSGSTLWRIDLGDRAWCLRRFPDAAEAHRLRAIHGVLAVMPEMPGWALARPAVGTSGRSLLEREGACWELTPWLPGSPLRNRPVPPGVIDAAMTGLAQFHSAAATVTRPSTGVPPSWHERRSAWQRWTRERVQRTQLALHGLNDAELRRRAELTLLALEKWAVRIATDLQAGHATHLQWVLRDVWRENLLFEDHRLTGLVDFGAMRVDTPATDVARLLGSLTHRPDEWGRGIGAYEQVRKLTVAERKLIPRYYRCGLLLSALSWLTWLVQERRAFADLAAALARWEELTADLGRLEVFEI